MWRVSVLRSACTGLVLLAVSAACIPLADMQGEPVLTSSESIVSDVTRVQRELLIGTWERRQPVVGGGWSEELASLYPDGTYEFRFRDWSADGSVDESEEQGFWGISGGIHFTVLLSTVDAEGIVLPANTRSAASYHAYEVIILTEGEFRYRSLETNNEFVLRRVTRDRKSSGE